VGCGVWGVGYGVWGVGCGEWGVGFHHRRQMPKRHVIASINILLLCLLHFGRSAQMGQQKPLENDMLLLNVLAALACVISDRY
jgi:hypothetical protein